MSQVRSANILFGDRILDRLKLQFLADGNWEAKLSDSGLPQEVQAVIRNVVSQTGLLRFEKAEIAQELINHFQDGRERDRSWETLVEDFGKVDVAVSLFRSSKLRSRPMSVKAFRGSFFVFGSGLLGYLLLQLFFHSAKPNPSVDYGAMLNEEVTSAPVELQAWPHYRDLWIKYGLAEGGGESFKEIYVKENEGSDGSYSRRLIRSSDEGWGEAVAKLESTEELLEAWREHSKLPHLGTPLHLDRREYSDADLRALFPHLKREQLDDNGINGWGVAGISDDANELLAGSAIGILLPHIQQFREAARILHVDTRLAVTQGDQERALANIKAIHGLGRQAADAPLSGCVLVGYAVQGIAFGVTEEVVVNHPDFFADRHLNELQQHAASLQFAKMHWLKFERNFAKDIIQRIYSDDGNGDGRVTAVGTEVQFAMSGLLHRSTPSKEESTWLQGSFVRSATAPVRLFSAPSRAEIEAMMEDAYEECNDRMRRPMWEADRTDWKEFLESEDDTGLLLSVLGGMGNMKNAREVKLAYRDAVLLALACHRYKKANQTWPANLDQLKGKWLKDTPIDRLNGKPLNFRIKDGAPVIYSLGHDGDDDGGVNTNSDAPWLDQDADGDWVVWPQADM